MWPDGVCRVTDSFYTKTIQFQDINYQLSQNEDKSAIFDSWCDFLNYFDSSIRIQLSFLNQYGRYLHDGHQRRGDRAEPPGEQLLLRRDAGAGRLYRRPEHKV